MAGDAARLHQQPQPLFGNVGNGRGGRQWQELVGRHGRGRGRHELRSDESGRILGRIQDDSWCSPVVPWTWEYAYLVGLVHDEVTARAHVEVHAHESGWAVVR